MCNKVSNFIFDYKSNMCTLGNSEKHKEENKVLLKKNRYHAIHIAL